MTARCILLVIVFFIFFLLPASAQVSYTRLNVEDGLSNSSVQCILQDKSGIVWIGTNSGLNRYDGAQFIQYNLLSTPALSSSVITTLMEDDAGNIWIGTENGINILNPVANRVRQFSYNKKEPESLPPGIVRCIQKMKDGAIWIMSDTWLCKFNGLNTFSRIAIDPSLLSATRVFAGITEAQEGHVWISYLDQPTLLTKKYKISEKRDSIGVEKISWPDYSRVYIDARKITWGITQKSVTRFDNVNGVFEPWMVNTSTANLSTLHVHTIYTADANGMVWQGSQAINLTQYDLAQKKITDYNWLLLACKATMVNCIYADSSNNIWIGTDNGIVKLSNRNFFFKTIPFTLQDKEIKDIRCRRITEDKYGALYAGTENYGLLKLEPAAAGGYTTKPLSIFGATAVSSLPVIDNKINVPAKARFDIGYMYDMWYDNNNTIWLSGYGLVKYDIVTGNMTMYFADEKETPHNESITLFSICNADSIIWTGGQRNLFSFNIATGRMHAFHDNKGNMPFRDIPCWSLVKKGVWLWAGTDKGLYKINTITKEVSKEQSDAALQLGINDIFTDTDSSLWISTAGGGVVHYFTETGKSIHYTTRDGLSNNTVCGILADASNNLWMSTYAGLNYLNRQTKQFASFYAKDGLNGDEFNRKAFSRLRNGDLVFGGLNGYTIFDAQDALVAQKPASLLLTSFSKTNATGTVSETIFGADTTVKTIIDPGDRFFSFSFTLTDMYDPASNRYSYKLEGVDNDWHFIGSQHAVSFMSLPSGSYTLRIKGFSAQHLVAKNELAIAIVVKQVFYKSAWFITMIVLLVAAITYGFVYYRIRQLKKVQALRTRIASDLHDEVGSNLVRITMLADTLKRENKDVKMQEQVGLIAGISRDAVSTIKDVIWNIDARNDTMADMISYMHEHVHSMLTAAGIEFSFQHAGVPGDQRPGIDFRQNVYLIFKEAINNIVKHSGATYTEINLQQKHGLFIMVIKDNGNGIAEKNYTSGQGLHNMKMRAKRLNASLEIESKNGLCITLITPV